MVFERRILAKNNDGRQTSSEVKPGRGFSRGDHFQIEAVVLILLFSVF